MEKKESFWSKPKKILRDAAIALALLWMLQTPSCQQVGEKEDPMRDGDAIEIVDKNIITEPWEYKIYKLDINAISSVKYDLLKAKKKVQASEVLKKYLTMGDFAYEKILPKITKESSLDNDRESRTGAIGYMQLTDRAIEEIYRVYDMQWVILNPQNPIDNIVLWVLYRKITEKNLTHSLKKMWLSFSEKDRDALMVFSYNVWETRALKFLQTAQKEWVKTMDWYIKWLVEKKLHMPYKPVEKEDPVYNVMYTDYFWWRKVSADASWEVKKLGEWIKYVAVIDALQDYLEADQTIEVIDVIRLQWKETLFSKVKEMRDKGVFKKDSSVNTICKVILETNWFEEKQTPQEVDLFLIKDVLKKFQ